MPACSFDSPNFDLLSHEFRAYLNEVGTITEYAKDDLILDYGLEEDFMPIIMSGCARVMRID